MNNLLAEIDKKIILDCEIELIGPLHVGSEREGVLGMVDNPIVKINDKPVIPGSSLKGALRTHLTRLINSLDDNKLKFLNLKKRSQYFDEIKFQKTENIDKKIEIIKNELSSVDKLFGISNLASPLFITSAIPSNNISTIVKPHIKININTDRTEQGSLFYVESIPPSPNNKFKFQIIFEVPKDHQIYSDAIKLFEYLENILVSENGLEIFLGGMKSRGYGLVKIKQVNKKELSIEDLLLGNYS
ncbi:MAG: RAMP superfamily CRISPR-associated protein [Candidatus Helarchaeota archaeon]